MEITKVTCPDNQVAIKCPYSMNPTRIVVHNTANDASAMSEISYMLRNENYTSFHYAVDDYRAVQGIEENRNSWNAGDGTAGTGNRYGIAIEICYSLSGGDLFVKAEQNAARLIAKILKERGWGIEQVTKHQDYSGKYCPHRTLDLGWERFLNRVRFELNPTLPVPAAIKFPEPFTIIMNLDKVQMWDLATNPNYKSAKEFLRGQEIDIVGYIPFKGIQYYVTDWTFSKGLKTGFNQNDVIIKRNPVITTAQDIVIRSIPFSKISVEDPTITTNAITTIGVNGQQAIIYTVTYTDGVETNRVLKSDETIPPVDEVTTIGTYVEPPVIEPPVEPPITPPEPPVVVEPPVIIDPPIITPPVEPPVKPTWRDFWRELYNKFIDWLKGKNITWTKKH